MYVCKQAGPLNNELRKELFIRYSTSNIESQNKLANNLFWKDLLYVKNSRADKKKKDVINWIRAIFPQLWVLHNALFRQAEISSSNSEGGDHEWLVKQSLNAFFATVLWFYHEYWALFLR